MTSLQIDTGFKRTGRVFGFIAALALVGCGGETSEAPETSTPRTEAGEFAEGELAIPVMGEEVRILAFGDSLFAGYNLAEPEGYPERLEAALRGRGINARVVDAGVSGDTSAAGRDRLAFTLDAQKVKPDLFILELGGNDLLRGLSPDETRANFEAMLTTLAEREIPVLLMGMRAPPNYGPEYQSQFDEMYGSLANQFGTALIPFWLEDIYEDPSLFLPDRIHPTAEGVEALVASTVDDVIAAVPEDAG
ncbi:MAG: arylesterase [Pseudomonadota bacterium]